MNNGQYLKSMGSKIKALRIAKKWSYPVLAKKTGLNMSNLWFIEQGRINLHLLTLKQIADVFEVDVKYFL